MKKVLILVVALLFILPGCSSLDNGGDDPVINYDNVNEMIVCINSLYSDFNNMNFGDEEVQNEISRIRTEYDALNDDEKQLITNYDNYLEVEEAYQAYLRIQNGYEEGIYQYKYTTLLLFDEEKNYMELLNVAGTTLTPDTKIYKLVNEEKQETTFADLIVGMNNLYVKTKNNQTIEEIVIDGEPQFSKIRVAIRQYIGNISDMNTLYHDEVDIYLTEDTTVQTFDGRKEYNLKGNTNIKIYTDGTLLYLKDNNNIISFDKRLIIKQSNAPVKINSIYRNSDCCYEGNLEFSLVDGRILLINDLLMEEYLKKVVPSEMPSEWGLEALKSQAVAARTFAYREIYKNKNSKYGYIVDDSESSQVYNNRNEQESTNRAIKETKGITMFYDNNPINAYYYSCSSGLTGNGHEVWVNYEQPEELKYLVGINTTDFDVDTTSEESLLQFFKTINMYSPSGYSTNFRWLVSMDKEQLRRTLNINIPLMVPGKEEYYPILENGEWVIKDFPEDIGEIKNIFVSERGESGIVISLQVEAENVTFRIKGQYNIRFTVRPKDCGSTIIRHYTTSNTGKYTATEINPSILNSAFFALEWNDDTLSFYGGGSGHGAGMCQFSANAYAREGKTYEEILQTFYKNIEFRNTSVIYTPTSDFIKYFD